MNRKKIRAICQYKPYTFILYYRSKIFTIILNQSETIINKFHKE